MAFKDRVRPNTLKNLYQNNSAKELGYYYGVSETTVRRALKYHGIRKEEIPQEDNVEQLTNAQIRDKVEEALFQLDHVTRHLAHLIPISVDEDGNVVVNQYISQGTHRHGTKDIKNDDFPIEMHFKVDRSTGTFKLISSELRGRRLAYSEQRKILDFLNG